MAFQYTPVASMPTVVTPRSASQAASSATPAVVVANRSLSSRTPPRGPGTRAHAATLSRCTSKAATRSRICSTLCSLPDGDGQPAGEGPAPHRIWGSCSQRHSKVPRVPTPDLLRAPTRHYRDGDRARRAVSISSLLGDPQGHADLFDLEVPGGKWHTVTARLVSAAKRASSVFHARTR